MDRVKGLRRATAAVVLVVASALILSCGADNAGLIGHTSLRANPGDIYGYVTGPYGAIEGASVRWVCITHGYTYLGSDTTDNSGYYEINAAAWSTEHEGDDLKGVATKEGYQDDDAYIYDYSPTGDYQRDFYLESTH